MARAFQAFFRKRLVALSIIFPTAGVPMRSQQNCGLGRWGQRVESERGGTAGTRKGPPHVLQHALAVPVVQWAHQKEVVDVLHHWEGTGAACAKRLGPGGAGFPAYAIHHWEAARAAQKLEARALRSWRSSRYRSGTRMPRRPSSPTEKAYLGGLMPQSLRGR